MQLPFWKYCSCGNDFVLIDNRKGAVELNKESIPLLCDRRRGVGADGLLLLSPSVKATCRMQIFNSDGSEAEMCGNGIRCVADFLKRSGYESGTTTIESMERVHRAEWRGERIAIEMGAPKNLNWEMKLDLAGEEIPVTFLDTGVPHAVHFCSDIEAIDVEGIGAALRNHKSFSPKGTNATFASIKGGKVSIRTYERGVEGETPACGTGATAAAIAAAKYGLKPPVSIAFSSGQELEIDYAISSGLFSSVEMIGSCEAVFEGVVRLSLG